MTEPSVSDLERDVQATRARLAQNLDTLRSPVAQAAFTQSLKREAFAAKDELVQKTRSAAEASIHGWVDSLKARAAENPAAVLAIGAGLAWHVIKRPPITTALIGVGLFSLMRGTGGRTGSTNAEYVNRAKTHLIRQSSELVGAATEQAKSASAKVGQTALEWADEAGSAYRQGRAKLIDAAVATAAAASNQLEAGREGSIDAAERIGRVATDLEQAVRDQAAEFADTTTAGVRTATERAGETMRQWRDQAGRSADHLRNSADAMRHRLGDSDVTGNVLLGVAGVAVAAALGVAVQRRISELEPAE